MHVFSLRRARLTCLGALALIGTTVTAQSPAPSSDPMIRDLRWRNVGNANLIGRISAIDALESDWATRHRRVGVGRRVEVGQRRDDVDDDLRQLRRGVDWRRADQPEESADHLGRHRRRVRAQLRRMGRRHLQVDRRRRDVHERRPQRVLQHRQDRPASDEREHRSTSPRSATSTRQIGERGVFKTIDGGKTWTKLTDGLPNDPGTGAIDMVMDPIEPGDPLRHVLAADPLSVGAEQRRPEQRHLQVGRTAAGRWTKLTKGLPTGDLGTHRHRDRAHQPARADGARRTRFPAARQSARPEQPGRRWRRRWRRTAAARRRGDQPRIPIDMTKLGAGMYRSEDGGATWTFLDRYHQPAVLLHARRDQPARRQVHLQLHDQLPAVDATAARRGSAQGGGGDGGHCWHAMWHDPHNKNRYYIGSDGGLNLTHDDGATSLRFNNINVTQYYDVAADNREPYWVCGGLQDAGSSCGPSATRAQAIYTSDWSTSPAVTAITPRSTRRTGATSIPNRNPT